jgi:signal transduction histidine kinase
MSGLPEDLERLLHDLRGPLNALTMHAEVLKRAVRGPAEADSVRAIQQEVERLAEMLAAAMQVVALERGQSARVNLRAVVERALEDARLKDVVVLSAEWPEVVGDPALLARAAAELLQNAVDATQARGPATRRPEVSAGREPDGSAALVVRDYGAGLRSTNPKVLIRLRTSTRPGHRGLGLVTVERIARLHGGRLRFSSPGDGAQTTLVLPSAEMRPSRGAATDPPPPPRSEPPRGTRGGRPR